METLTHITAVKIIEASWKHYAVLGDLGRTTFIETFADDNTEEDMNAYLTKTYSKEKMLENIKNIAIKYFVAYGETQDIGYLKLLHNVNAPGLDGKVMEIEKIYVRKENLGTRVGAALMEKAIKYAKENNYDYLYLGVWQDNTRAISFYEKFGFKTFTTRKFALGKRICDDFLMALQIS